VRRLLLAMFAAHLALATMCVEARAPRHDHQEKPPVAEPSESQLIEHGRYTNKAGESVHSPAHTKDSKRPAGASAQCRDGSYSFSHSHRGTCSRHGGVAAWL
jgi:hypothetical protein